MIRHRGRRSLAEPSLETAAYDHPDSRDLLNCLYAEQLEMYGFADPPEDTAADDYCSPGGLFLVAYRHPRSPVGCGGWRRTDDCTAEIKRMYVRREARGQGLGRRLLLALERDAAAAGIRFMLLETGRDNLAAQQLYSTAGYRPIPAYRPGRNPEVNRALCKSLSVGQAV